jgi:release factor glutamine methyltransferase
LERSPTVAVLLDQARRRLAHAAVEPPSREAHLLLGHVLGRSEASLRARPEEPVADDLADRFRALVERRRRGEPVAYLFGEQEFYGRPFTVDPRVLIPRPETEHLVEAALALDLPAAPRILDVGTGSGCIAVTLALEIPGARLVATDVSLPALRVARSNAERHGAARVAMVRADLAAALQLERFDLVASNPPYVDPEDAATAADVREFEPWLALFAEDSGRGVLARLLGASGSLRPGVHLLLEIGYDQGEWLRASVPEHLKLLDVVRDYGGIPRTAVLRRRLLSTSSE